MSTPTKELTPLRALARAMGVATRYTDGLGRKVVVGPETLLRVCTAVGAPVSTVADATEALRAVRAGRGGGLIPPVIVAWDGVFAPVPVAGRGKPRAELHLEQGGQAGVECVDRSVRLTAPLPLGYHRLTVEAAGRQDSATVIATPVHAWRRPGTHRSWGVGTHLAALRSARSRSVGDLRDLRTLCEWVRERGGDLVTALPLLPTFNSPWPEPSPYSPVSRLFWSELILDLGEAHHPVPAPARLDVSAAEAEVRAALAGRPAPDPAELDEELLRYARFRGAQVKLGRNWREWPAAAQGGTLAPEHVDPDEERFHLVAQTMVRRQLQELRQHLDGGGFRLGLDLAVGSHSDGYDTWSRQDLFVAGMSVGAPPDAGFPGGQDWGFSPVHPGLSRREGHRYLAASIAHQASLAGVLRVDHIMAWTRLYWIPHGMGLHQGTYVTYPADELFAILSLESNRYRCEVVGENLGTVPPEIFEALPRHRIWGMYLAMFQASGGPNVTPPTSADMALVGTHDTPTFAGWLAGNDIKDRVHYGMLAERAAPAAIDERVRAIGWLADTLGVHAEDRKVFFAALLTWLARSDSPLVVPWLEDLWLEEVAVNLPGTPSSLRPNWQRPMRRLLEEIYADPEIDALLRQLHATRNAAH